MRIIGQRRRGAGPQTTRQRLCFRRSDFEEFMKTLPVAVASFVISLVIVVEAGGQALTALAPPLTVSHRPSLNPVPAPYPFISPFVGSNGFYSGLFPMKSISLPPFPALSSTTMAMQPLMVSSNRTTSTGSFRVVKAPRWLTNAFAVSNAIAQAPTPPADRPLPPTGLRIISIGP